MIPSDTRHGDSETVAAALARLTSQNGTRRVRFDPYSTDWPTPIDPDTAEYLATIPPTDVLRRNLADAEAVHAEAVRLASSQHGEVALTALYVVNDLTPAVARLRAAIADAAARGPAADLTSARERLADAERRLADAEHAMAVHGPDYVLRVLEPPKSRWFVPPPPRSDAERALARARGALRQAEARDALLAARPEGCWCFGVGGRGRTWVLDDEAAACGTDFLYREHCACPEGQLRAARDAAARDRLDTFRRATRRDEDLLTASVPGLFRGLTLASYPVLDADPAAGIVGNRESFDKACRWWSLFKAGTARKNSLLLWGDPGVGKSGFSAAVFDDWQAWRRQRGEPTNGIFVVVPDLLDAMRSTFDRHDGASVDDLMNRIRRAPFVVLDDVGTEKMTAWGAEKLFQIINSRHDERMPTLITTNLSVGALEVHFGAAVDRDAGPEQREIARMRGKRLVRRVLEMAEVLEFRGDDLSDDAVRAYIAARAVAF